MSLSELQERFDGLKGKEVSSVAETDGYLHLQFSDGTEMNCLYWRLTEPGHTKLSNFDHLQEYGSQSKTDAFQNLENRLL